MVEGGPPDGERDRTEETARWLGRVGVDWWAVLVVAVITLLAIAGVLPKIGW